MLFGLLSEYVQLFRREQEKTRRLREREIEREHLLEQERRLLYAIGHDMRAPATIITGQVQLIRELLQDSGVVTQIQPHVNALERALSRMSTMTSDITEVSVLEDEYLGSNCRGEKWEDAYQKYW
ncbi:MAG: hypothetical protein ACYDCO_01505 [Armatimonadota bacterium]